jgi:hypothetical protein
VRRERRLLVGVGVNPIIGNLHVEGDDAWERDPYIAALLRSADHYDAEFSSRQPHVPLAGLVEGLAVSR